MSAAAVAYQLILQTHGNDAMRRLLLTGMLLEAGGNRGQFRLRVFKR